jgi:Sulfotransferase domain
MNIKFSKQLNSVRKHMLNRLFTCSVLFSLTILCEPLCGVYQPSVEIRNDPSKANNVLFLVSFPRSGSHWTKNILQIIGEIPIYPLCGTYDLENPLNVDLNFDNVPCFVMHNPHWIKGASTTENQLIVIVRDYKECFLRQAKAEKSSIDYETISQLKFNGQKYGNFYCDIIDLYDNWDVNKRLLIYYEDLINCPYSTLTIIFSFLKIDHLRVISFMNNFETYKKLSISHYNKIQQNEGGAMSEGNSTSYHSNDLTRSDLMKFDDYMSTEFSFLWNKYLTRYLSEDE